LQCRCQPSQHVECAVVGAVDERTHGRHRLQAHMVGSRRQVLLDAGDDGCLVAPCHDGIDERVRPGVGEVGGREAEPFEVADVVRRAEVEAAGVLARQPACFVRIALEHHRQLGREQLALSQDPARAARVLDRYEVRVRAVGGVTRELEHPRPERGEHDGWPFGRSG
jgi:hypothetical protein